MAELSPRDRLQPFLLDRLTDDQPEAQQESRERRVFSPKQIQVGILRDLGWLLNSKARQTDDPISEFPEVAKSVLNYGIPELSGNTISSVNVNQMERTLSQAIRHYEPRIISESLQVRVLTEAETHNPNVLAFEIKGELSANPMAEPLFIKTEVDLETGSYLLKDRSHG